ncbi:MAG: FMN-binding negative transcriptional regulator [Gammaproteobacteria bacterium]|nr:FMN-binding negative transcriptional regulator [Gammaproteobacteria bacterium]
MSYPPTRHAETDEARIFDAIDAIVQGTLIVREGRDGNDKLHFSYVPFLLDRDARKLIGHIAKVNPQHELMDGEMVDVVFHGPHAYISPALFDNKKVPTWNYVNVEVRGRALVMHERDEKLAIIRTLTEKMEGDAQPYFDADAERIERLVNAIVGFSIDIESLTGRFKLGRNDEMPVQQKAFDVLESSTPPELRDWLESLRPAD